MRYKRNDTRLLETATLVKQRAARISVSNTAKKKEKRKDIKYAHKNRMYTATAGPDQ
jgi:hypothetical protein